MPADYSPPCVPVSAGAMAPASHVPAFDPPADTAPSRALSATRSRPLRLKRRESPGSICGCCTGQVRPGGATRSGARARTPLIGSPPAASATTDPWVAPAGCHVQPTGQAALASGRTVTRLLGKRLPGTHVTLRDVGSVAELARSARRAEHDHLRRLAVLRVERDLPYPAATVRGAASALLAGQSLPPVHCSYLTRFRSASNPAIVEVLERQTV